MRSQRHRFLRSRGSRFLPACLNVLAAAVASATGCAGTAPPAGQRELMIVANDNKQSWDAAGKVLLAAPGQQHAVHPGHRHQPFGAPDRRQCHVAQ